MGEIGKGSLGMLKKGLLEELEGLSFQVRVKAVVSASLTEFGFVLCVYRDVTVSHNVERQ